MSFKDTDIKGLANQDHEVFGSDFCTGYSDIFGKWNTGFDCPRMGNGETVYCCGTVTYKYCCTRRDQQNGVGITPTLIVGSVLGSVLIFFLVALISCLILKRCIPYRRAIPALVRGQLYTMHSSSTASGMANMYAFSGQNTAVTTPLDTPHVLVDLDGTEHIYAQLNHQRGLGRQIARNPGDGHPTEPPPPYNERLSDSESNMDSPNLTTGFVTRAASDGVRPNSERTASTNQRRDGDVIITPQTNQYWSTKF